MDGSALRPVDPSRLEWLEPPCSAGGRFDEVQPRLARLVSCPQDERVYRAKRRCIYRAVDEVLGPVGIKEVRSEGVLRRMLFGFVREHPALHEFTVGSAFAARGGGTPAFLGAAVERGRLGPDRVLLFLRWLDHAVTVSEFLAKVGPEPDTAILAGIAEALAGHARLGLVHGRHGTSNLLAVPRDGGVPEIFVIDFAYSKLGDGLDAKGFVRDVGRIGMYMVHLGVCTRPKVHEFLDLVAAAAWPDAETAARQRRALEAGVDAWLREAGKRF